MPKGFRPMEIPARLCGRQSVQHIRYRIERHKATGTRISFMLPACIYKRVKPVPKAWRIDIDPESKRGRFTAMIEATEKGVKTHREREDGNSIVLSWAYECEFLEFFPDTKRVEPLMNHTLTTMGIEFDLPKL